jgi:hypothetical protein
MAQRAINARTEQGILIGSGGGVGRHRLLKWKN